VSQTSSRCSHTGYNTGGEYRLFRTTSSLERFTLCNLWHGVRPYRHRGNRAAKKAEICAGTSRPLYALRHVNISYRILCRNFFDNPASYAGISKTLLPDHLNRNDTHCAMCRYMSRMFCNRRGKCLTWNLFMIE
jgi:hypothetical protein